MTVENEIKLLDYLHERGKKGVTIQRYKGLGEMAPEQLWQTTMNPENRALLKVSIRDAVEADDIFAILMGDDVERRGISSKPMPASRPIWTSKPWPNEKDDDRPKKDKPAEAKDKAGEIQQPPSPDRRRPDRRFASKRR